MALGTKHLEVTLGTEVESVNLAEAMCLRVAQAAGFGEDDCYRIGMSVREGMINAFHYGNQERPGKKIHLAVDLTPDKMVIHVLDEGTGFDLSSVPDPLAEENLLSTSGRGIFLMRTFMDEFDVVPGRTGGAEIIMSKKLPSVEPPGGSTGRGEEAAKEHGGQDVELRATYRDAGSVTVVDMGGRITLGEGSALLRRTIRDLLEQKRANILLNLADVDYIDSSGIGELVSGYAAVKKSGGNLKLLQLTKKVHDVLQLTRLFTVFEVYTDERTALRSFHRAVG
jgi:anti-sigma B factor antagonist